MATVAPPQVALDKYPSYGVAYNAILEHIFTYPGTYKPPPLFADSTGRRPSEKRHSMPPNISEPTTPVAYDSSSRTRRESATPISPAPRSATEFTSALMEQISSSPAQPGSLPLAFINSFLRHCFPPELELVDFPQALTGLDHLADLESRRRREMEAALERLRVSRQTLESDANGLALQHPSIAAWVRDVEPSERKIEALYTQLYVGLRRWILINEFSLTPFHKLNCLAMLNTLFPPMQPNKPTVSPTPALTPSVLHKQREVYVAYLKAVESRGTGVLHTLMNQNKRTGDPHGWPAVRDILDKYLRVTNMLIDEAGAIDDWGAFKRHDPKPAPIIAPPIPPKNRYRSTSVGRLKRKTTDSGVSFDSTTGSYTSSSHASVSGNRDSNRPTLQASPYSSSGAIHTLKPLPTLPVSPTSPTTQATPPTSAPRKSTSTLEKIAHTLRKFKARRKSQATPPQSPTIDQKQENKENVSSSPRSPSSSPPPGNFPPTTNPTAIPTAPANAPTLTKDKDSGKASRRMRSLTDIKNYARSSPPSTVTVSESSTSGGSKASDRDRDDDTSPRRASCDSRRRDRDRDRDRDANVNRNKSQSRSRNRGRTVNIRADEAEAFDRDEMMRQRAIWEARVGLN